VETSAAINSSRMDVTLEATADITLQIADSDASGGSGVNGAQVLRVTVATDDEINVDLDLMRIAVQLLDDTVFVDDTATHSTGATVGLGVMAAATPTDTAVAANDIGMLAMSLDRRLLVDADITASVALDVSAATVTVTATNLDVQIGGSDTVTVTATNLDVQSGGADLATEATLGTIDTDTGNIVTAVQIIDNPVQVLGTDTYLEATDSANIVGVVRNDALATLASLDNEIAPIQVNASGAVYVGLATVGSAAQAISLNTGTRDAGTIRVSIATDDVVPVTLEATADITIQIADSDASGGSGVNGAQVLRVTVATDDEINDDLDLIRIATQLIDDAISGTEMQVDVVAALPTGANTIGEVTIGTATTAGTDLAKAEDAAHTTADVGVMVLGVRQSAQADFGGG